MRICRLIAAALSIISASCALETETPSAGADLGRADTSSVPCNVTGTNPLQDGAIVFSEHVDVSQAQELESFRELSDFLSKVGSDNGDKLCVTKTGEQFWSGHAWLQEKEMPRRAELAELNDGRCHAMVFGETAATSLEDLRTFYPASAGFNILSLRQWGFIFTQDQEISEKVGDLDSIRELTLCATGANAKIAVQAGVLEDGGYREIGDPACQATVMAGYGFAFGELPAIPDMKETLDLVTDTLGGGRAVYACFF